MSLSPDADISKLPTTCHVVRSATVTQGNECHHIPGDSREPGIVLGEIMKKFPAATQITLHLGVAHIDY